ncbi:hypothetical protein CEXT_269961 [Caerostris extrusa]|uniref:Uncharacterized protein n=1 Tax=Caerostris extrusa TaxID=172846 RepID=A0AAV4P7M0_CAEEX|nr:hypothetical protein CEXT_269961 [Caerostris extrusa]
MPGGLLARACRRGPKGGGNRTRILILRDFGEPLLFRKEISSPLLLCAVSDRRRKPPIPTFALVSTSFVYDGDLPYGQEV